MDLLFYLYFSHRWIKQVTTAARDLLVSLRCALAAVNCSLATVRSTAVKCSQVPWLLPSMIFHLVCTREFSVFLYWSKLKDK